MAYDYLTATIPPTEAEVVAYRAWLVAYCETVAVHPLTQEESERIELDRR